MAINATDIENHYGRKSGTIVRVTRDKRPVPASSEQNLSIHFDAALPAELTSAQVCVVARINVVMRQRLVHIHINV